MDRKSKKHLRNEVKQQETKVTKEVKAGADALSDRQVVAKVEKKQQGGTLEGASEVKRRLAAAGKSIRQEFDAHAAKRKELLQQVEADQAKDAQQRYASYQDAQASAQAAGDLKDRKLKGEFGTLRDAHAKEAVFFKEQHEARDKLSSQSERLGGEMEKQMTRLDGGAASGEGPASDAEKSKKIKVEWTNPDTGEKFIHKEKGDGIKHLYYGPPDTKEQKNHGHAAFDEHGRPIFDPRNPRGE